MFLSKKALSWKTLPLAAVVVAAGIFGLIWLGADPAEARGRSATLTRNNLVAPGTPAGNAPCLQSLVEWEPLGSKVEVEFLLQWKPVNSTTWRIQALDKQLLPGKATRATVDWGYVAPGLQYRHIVWLYSVKGKNGVYRNRQLVSEYSIDTPVVFSCEK